MKKLVFTFLILVQAAFGATCLTVVKSSRQCDLSTNIVDDYTLNPRGFRLKTPTNYAADGTHPLIIAFNGSTSASFPGGGFETTTGWSTKADAVAAALAPAIIYPDSLYGSRFRIERISGDGTTVTVVTKEVHNLGVGDNVSISGTTTFDSTSKSITAVSDAHTFQYLAATITPVLTGFIANVNKSWNNYVQKNIPDFADDVAFINALLAEQLPILNPDRTKIFLVGWSSGAIFSHHYAIERSDLIAAIGSAEGFFATTDQHALGTSASLDTQSVPGAPHTFSAILFGGTSDSTVHNCSDQIRTTFYSRNSMGETPIYLANAMKCSTIPTNLGNNAMCTKGTSAAPSSISCNSTHTTTGVVVTMNAAAHTAVRASGSWVTDGFVANDYVTMHSGFATSAGSWIPTNNGVNCRIASVVALSITFTDAVGTRCNIVDEVTGTGATFYDNLTLVFTMPSSPVSGYGFSTSPPNNGVRWFNLGDPKVFQADCSITGAVSGSTVTTAQLANCWSGPAQAYCTPGAVTVGSTTVEPRPYFPAANNQGAWLATGCADNVQIQAYSLEGGGHSYYAQGNPGSGTITGTIAAAARTLTRSSGNFSNDGFITNMTVLMSGFSIGANNTNCVASSVAATVITFTAACSSLVDEGPTATAAVTLYDLVPMNANLPAGETETDIMWDFFLQHPKASRSGYKQEIRGIKH